MNLKKIIALLLSCILVLSLFGCSNNVKVPETSEPVQTDPPTEPPTKETEPIVETMSQQELDDKITEAMALVSEARENFLAAETVTMVLTQRNSDVPMTMIINNVTGEFSFISERESQGVDGDGITRNGWDVTGLYVIQEDDEMITYNTLTRYESQDKKEVKTKSVVSFKGVPTDMLSFAFIEDIFELAQKLYVTDDKIEQDEEEWSVLSSYDDNDLNAPMTMHIDSSCRLRYYAGSSYLQDLSSVKFYYDEDTVVMNDEYRELAQDITDTVDESKIVERLEFLAPVEIEEDLLPDETAAP